MIHVVSPGFGCRTRVLPDLWIFGISGMAGSGASIERLMWALRTFRTFRLHFTPHRPLPGGARAAPIMNRRSEHAPRATEETRWATA
ncbi:hypothetical protein BGLT_07164 [Caballeronia glathei]|nr:hypothetical protein BGLT_07164 [Caballeronia glathei]